jgi:PBP1b-binding outer membrane lipoprotein LpoB
MSRTNQLVMLVSSAVLLGACSQSPTGPTEQTRATAPTPNAAPVKPNADLACDWINPWTYACH